MFLVFDFQPLAEVNYRKKGKLERAEALYAVALYAVAGNKCSYIDDGELPMTQLLKNHVQISRVS